MQGKQQVDDIGRGLVGVADERMARRFVHVAQEIDQSPRRPTIASVVVGKPRRHAVGRSGSFGPLHFEQAPFQQVEGTAFQDGDSGASGVQDVQSQPHQAEKMAGSVARGTRLEGCLQPHQPIRIHPDPIRRRHPIRPRLVQSPAILHESGAGEFGPDLPEQGQSTHFRDHGQFLGPAVDS
jgi:hypothetical protein